MIALFMWLINVKLNSYCIFPDEELSPDELETIFIIMQKD